MSGKKESLPPLVVNAVVELAVEDAFDLFTRRIAEWWPLATHAVGGDAAETVVLEARVGGRIHEVCADGTRHEWGQVLECEPPRRIVFTWHPGRDPEAKQTVEVLFAADGNLTHVELVHRDWDVFGEKAEKMHAEYTEGWGKVLGERFVEACGSA